MDQRILSPSLHVIFGLLNNHHNLSFARKLVVIPSCKTISCIWHSVCHLQRLHSQAKTLQVCKMHTWVKLSSGPSGCSRRARTTSGASSSVLNWTFDGLLLVLEGWGCCETGVTRPVHTDIDCLISTNVNVATSDDFSCKFLCHFNQAPHAGSLQTAAQASHAPPLSLVGEVEAMLRFHRLEHGSCYQQL